LLLVRVNGHTGCLTDDGKHDLYCVSLKEHGSLNELRDDLWLPGPNQS
jgi:hypothetical protein